MNREIVESVPLANCCFSFCSLVYCLLFRSVGNLGVINNKKFINIFCTTLTNTNQWLYKTKNEHTSLSMSGCKKINMVETGRHFVELFEIIVYWNLFLFYMIKIDYHHLVVPPLGSDCLLQGNGLGLCPSYELNVIWGLYIFSNGWEPFSTKVLSRRLPST